jgi:hypothetical protein
MATKPMKIGGAVVAAGVVASGAFLAGTSMVDSPKTTVATRARPTTPSTSTGTLVEFRDETAGWAIGYPKDWNRLQSGGGGVALVLSENPPEQNRGGSILARNVTLAAAVDASNLPAARELTDKVVTTGEGVDLLTPATVVNQGGLPGYFYFYRFKDPASGQMGVHSHYFLFKGSTMISFVFQALPEAQFRGLATLFDEVIGSFRTL